MASVNYIFAITNAGTPFIGQSPIIDSIYDADSGAAIAAIAATAAVTELGGGMYRLEVKWDNAAAYGAYNKVGLQIDADNGAMADSERYIFIESWRYDDTFPVDVSLGVTSIENKVDAQDTNIAAIIAGQAAQGVSLGIVLTDVGSVKQGLFGSWTITSNQLVMKDLSGTTIATFDLKDSDGTATSENPASRELVSTTV